MYTRTFTRADGRELWLFSRNPVSASEPAQLPAVAISAHMRWHPLLEEWVLYPTHRQDRTFLPSEDPLAPASDPERPTELPPGDYDVAVFENRFPSLARAPGVAPVLEGVSTSPSVGRCEVVVFSQGMQGLSELPLDHVALILEVLGARTRDLAAQGMAYVLPFQNRGTEMGVTLHHPHGQIYAYSFLPALQLRQLGAQTRHYIKTGVPLLSELVNEARQTRRRLIQDEGTAVSFVPSFARFPYEIWVAPERPVAMLWQLASDERHALAAVLTGALKRLDALFAKPMPYLMTINQAPPQEECPAWVLRIEICPIGRASNKLKFLAGTELGAGVFASDMTPEFAAEALKSTSI